MHRQANEQLEVFVSEPGRLDELLDEAEAILRQNAAPQCRSGILVTRLSPWRYELAFSESVPFGETREHLLS